MQHNDVCEEIHVRYQDAAERDQDSQGAIPMGHRRSQANRAKPKGDEAEARQEAAMNPEEMVVSGSGNIFADLGLEDADEDLAKVELAAKIRQRVKAKGLTQTQAAQVLGTDQGRVSDVMTGKIGGMTYDRLLRFLKLLECNVRIIVEEPNEDHSQGRVFVGSITH
ncbi:MAG TPA: helix-turn-helix transcriptional regulator [Chthonomonadaceae bacterium]|nr:helix-turn-helix transcriptional regulator [Chthonomonadaceae bacterium]